MFLYDSGELNQVKILTIFSLKYDSVYVEWNHSPGSIYTELPTVGPAVHNFRLGRVQANILYNHMLRALGYEKKSSFLNFFTWFESPFHSAFFFFETFIYC